MGEQNRIDTLCAFLRDDVENATLRGIDSAVRKRWRLHTQIEKLAGEVSLEINQILLNAKRELADEPSTSPIQQVIHELDEKVSVDALIDRIEEGIGLAFVHEVKDQLARQLQKALVAFHTYDDPAANVGRAVKEYALECQQVCTLAHAQAQDLFTDPDVLELVLLDLDHMLKSATDLNTLSLKFQV